MQRPGVVKIICPRERTSRDGWQLIYGRRVPGTSVSGLSFRSTNPFTESRVTIEAARSYEPTVFGAVLSQPASKRLYLTRSSMNLQTLLIHRRRASSWLEFFFFVMILEFLAIGKLPNEICSPRIFSEINSV